MFKKKNQSPPARTVRQRPYVQERRDNASVVFSYHANRTASPRTDGLAQERHTPATGGFAGRLRKLSAHRRGLWIGVAAITAAVLFGFGLALHTPPKVVPLGTADSAIFLQSQETYEAAVREVFRQSWRHSNKITIDAQRITAHLQAQFPELEAVIVSVPVIGSQVKVYIEPAVPGLILAAGPEQFIVASNGHAIMAAHTVPNLEELRLPVVTDQSGLPLELGRPALPRNHVAYITEVVGQLQAKNMPIASLTLLPGTDELHLRVQGTPYFVKFNVQGNARVEAGAFLAVKKQLERENKTPAEYIDVRVENRAYYK